MAEARAVVVTGASTGIGEASARHLAQLGFDVFAGVRRDEDAERARERGLRPLRIDVTDLDSLEAARAEVADAVGERGLAGLVNNAGVAVSGPLEFVPIEELRRQLDVNLVGQVAVTQRFIALLRTGRGRIVNISSIGGRVALPLAGPYAASKFALEAVSDSLRRELRPWGIGVSVIEPGGVKTPIWAKGKQAANEMLRRMPPEAMELYGELAARIRSEADKIETERGIPPEEVAEQVAHALTANKPKTRYVVGRDARMRAALARRLPDRAMDALIARALRT